MSKRERERERERESERERERKKKERKKDYIKEKNGDGGLERKEERERVH